MDLKIDLTSLNPGQRKFIESEAKQVLLCGGFGSGKTAALAVKILILKAANTGVDGLVVAQTFGSLEAVVLSAIYDLFKRAGVPEKKWPTHRDRRSGRDWLDFGDKDRVHLRSADTAKNMDGLNVGWLAGDEIRHWNKRTYDIAIGRRRINCPMPQSVFASTPAMNWMAEEFNTSKPGRDLIQAPTKENEANLAEGFIDNLRQSYSPRMQRAVLDGEFTILEGAVFEDYDPNPKTSDWMVDWDVDNFTLRKYRIFLAADPGFRRSAWLWIAQVGHMEWVVFDQAMLDNHSDEAACRVINDKRHPIDEIWIDPAAGSTQSAFGIDTLKVLRAGIRTRSKAPFRSVDMYRDIRFGVDKLRVLLGGYQDLPKRIRFSKQMALKEASQPRGIVKDLGALAYPEVRDGRAITDLPLKDGMTDHSTDALRYFAVSRWLCEPELRQVDPKLREEKNDGYKIHFS